VRPWWQQTWALFLTLPAMRKRRCAAAGTHHPEHIGYGQKLCPECGAW
jgi:hypothetical protein